MTTKKPVGFPKRRPPDGHLPHLTRKELQAALFEFPISFTADRDLDWLTDAVRTAMEYSVVDEPYGPERKSNVELRNDIESIGRHVENLIHALNARGYQLDLHLKWAATCIAEGDGPTPYGKMIDILDGLHDLLPLIEAAYLYLEEQAGPWRQSERKFWRIERGVRLAAIYQEAFGKLPTSNNYPNDPRHKAPTPFMEFYTRLISLSFGARETVNLAEVTKAACKIYRGDPLRYRAEVAGFG